MDLITTIGTATITLRWDVTAGEPKVDAYVELEAGQPFPTTDVLRSLATAMESSAKQLRAQAGPA